MLQFQGENNNRFNKMDRSLKTSMFQVLFIFSFVIKQNTPLWHVLCFLISWGKLAVLQKGQHWECHSRTRLQARRSLRHPCKSCSRVPASSWAEILEQVGGQGGRWLCASDPRNNRKGSSGERKAVGWDFLRWKTESAPSWRAGTRGPRTEDWL